jgi:hypothetical protein
MSRIWQSGFDARDPALADISGTPTYSTSTTRGSWSSASFNADGTGCQFQIPGGPYTEIYLRFGFYSGVINSTVRNVITFRTAAAADVAFFSVITAGPQYQLRSSTGGQTITWNPLPSTWYLVEIRIKVATTSTGILELKVDGTTIGTVTNANNGTVGIDRWVEGNGFNSAFIDDMVINDTAGGSNNSWPGDGRVTAHFPNAAGDSTDLSLGGSSPAATNWQSVDEHPPVVANYGVDYVAGLTIGNDDLYNVEAADSNMGAVKAVQVRATAQKSDAGAASLGLQVKSGSTTDEETPHALTTSWASYTDIWDTNPDTAAAWTKTNIDALQIGVVVE